MGHGCPPTPLALALTPSSDPKYLGCHVHNSRPMDEIMRATLARCDLWGLSMGAFTQQEQRQAREARRTNVHAMAMLSSSSEEGTSSSIRKGQGCQLNAISQQSSRPWMRAAQARHRLQGPGATRGGYRSLQWRPTPLFYTYDAAVQR